MPGLRGTPYSAHEPMDRKLMRLVSIVERRSRAESYRARPQGVLLGVGSGAAPVDTPGRSVQVAGESGGGAAGVSELNGLTGDIDIQAQGVTVTPTGQLINITRALLAALGGSTGGTDNRLLRSDGTGGATAQATGITVDDSDNVSGVTTLNMSGTATIGGDVDLGAGGDVDLGTASDIRWTHASGSFTMECAPPVVGDLTKITWSAEKGASGFVACSLSGTVQSFAYRALMASDLPIATATDNGAVNVDNATIVVSGGGEISVGANSLGPTQIDETVNYAWSGNNTHSGTEKFSASGRHIVELPTVLNRFFVNVVSGTITGSWGITASTLSTDAIATLTLGGGSGTLDAWFPIMKLDTDEKGGAIIPTGWNMKLAKPTDTSTRLSCTARALAQRTSDATTSTAATMADVTGSSNTGTVLSGAASGTYIIETKSGLTQALADGWLYGRLRIVASNSPTGTITVALESSHTYVDYNNNG